MASPEVERPLTSPSHHPGGYVRPHHPQLTAHGQDKKKTLNFRHKKTEKRPTLSTNTAFVRKRSYSFSEGHCKTVTSVTPAKRWKKAKDQKFLLGGNIRDPLNLNSLSDEKVSRVANAVTPEYSPIPTPKHRKAEYKIEVLIPNDISDPLNLMHGGDDDDYDASFNKKKSRHRKRNHNRSKAESPKEVKKVRFEEEVQNSVEKTVDDTAAPEQEAKKPTIQSVPEVKDLPVTKQAKFQYGNYNRYYGYRLEGSDPRLQYLDPDWFRGKDVLDIGCNVGEVTMAIARDMLPTSITGIDIDPTLISKARKMISQYANRKVPSAMATPNPGIPEPPKTERFFPQSLPVMYGPLDPTTSETVQQPQFPLVTAAPSLFPHNLKFLCDNYVLESDDLLEFAQPEFDAILCLSTTKWMHLNFGDEGLKRAFKRMFAQLRPNGVLVLEPQGLPSYSKKAKKINAVTKENFKNMKFFPAHFVEYLINQVGFTGGDVLAVPEHSALGFRRPIHVSIFIASMAKVTGIQYQYKM